MKFKKTQRKAFPSFDNELPHDALRAIFPIKLESTYNRIVPKGKVQSSIWNYYNSWNGIPIRYWPRAAALPTIGQKGTIGRSTAYQLLGYLAVNMNSPTKAAEVVLNHILNISSDNEDRVKKANSVMDLLARNKLAHYRFYKEKKGKVLYADAVKTPSKEEFAAWKLRMLKKFPKLGEAQEGVRQAYRELGAQRAEERRKQKWIMNNPWASNTYVHHRDDEIPVGWKPTKEVRKKYRKLKHVSDRTTAISSNPTQFEMEWERFAPWPTKQKTPRQQQAREYSEAELLAIVEEGERAAESKPKKSLNRRQLAALRRSQAEDLEEEEYATAQWKRKNLQQQEEMGNAQWIEENKSVFFNM